MGSLDHGPSKLDFVPADLLHRIAIDLCSQGLSHQLGAQADAQRGKLDVDGPANPVQLAARTDIVAVVGAHRTTEHEQSGRLLQRKLRGDLGKQVDPLKFDACLAKYWAADPKGTCASWQSTSTGFMYNSLIRYA